MNTIQKLKIFYPLQTGEQNPILRKGGAKIQTIDEHIQEMGEILMELMWEYDGVGLAAPQIGQNIAMIATTQRKKSPSGKYPEKDFISETLLINPEILERSPETQITEEACLSIPGKQGKVERHQRILVKFQDLEGQRQQKKYSGFNATIIQHEIDHLNGILFTDKILKESNNNQSNFQKL